VSKRRKPGRAAANPEPPKVRDVFVARPFEGLPDEPEWIALRELVPAATAKLRLAPDLAQKYGDREVTLATVLPMAWPALTKPDGRIFLGLQRSTQSGDVNRDVALSLLLALETPPGGPVSIPPLPGVGPRLADVLDPGPLDVTMQDGFEFWLDEQSTDPEVTESLERANASIFPTVRMAAAPAAYWCQFPEKAHVRWVLADDEDVALSALARVAASGEMTLGDSTRFAGMFRAHGLLVPVWDLPREAEAVQWEEPLQRFVERYRSAVGVGPALDADARRARQGLLGRQLTLR
jgi:hypothetical protein